MTICGCVLFVIQHSRLTNVRDNLLMLSSTALQKQLWDRLFGCFKIFVLVINKHIFVKMIVSVATVMLHTLLNRKLDKLQF